jgi:hypothetical protein
VVCQEASALRILADALGIQASGSGGRLRGVARVDSKLCGGFWLELGNANGACWTHGIGVEPGFLPDLPGEDSGVNLIALSFAYGDGQPARSGGRCCRVAGCLAA